MTLQRHILDQFTGIQEVRQEFINEVHGLTDIAALSLQRTKGKLLCTTGMSSAIWTVAQLKFQDGYAIVNHQGTGYMADPDLPPLPGVVYPLPLPPTGQPLPPNGPTLPPAPRYPTGSPRNSNLMVRLGVDPTSLTFEATEGEDPPDPQNVEEFALPESIVDTIVRGWTKITWAKNWMIVKLFTYAGWVAIAKDTCVHLKWNAFGADPLPRFTFEVDVDWDEVPVGSDLDNLVFLGVANSKGDDLRNSDGSIIGTYCPVAIQKLASPDVMSLKLTCPAHVTRGTAFNLTIQGWNTTKDIADTSYAPTTTVTVTKTSGVDNLVGDPISVPNTGWVKGAKTVSVTLSGGSGEQAAAVLHGQDDSVARDGSVSLDVSTVAPLNVQFTGYLSTAENTWPYVPPNYVYHTFTGDMVFVCTYVGIVGGYPTWRWNGSGVPGHVFSDGLFVANLGSSWRVTISSSWGSYWGSAIYWASSVQLGAYAFHSRPYGSFPPSIDGVTQVEVSA